jgi:hypothetical protein
MASAIAIGVIAADSLAAAASTVLPTQIAQADQLADGVYLYGQTPEPEQVGQGYFVFEVTRGNVVGALYMPRSSFDCAAGKFEQNELALTVVNSYDRSTNPFEIAIERNVSVASSGNPAIQRLELQGFHRLPTVSENDQRMLNVCKDDLRSNQATQPAR